MIHFPGKKKKKRKKKKKGVTVLKALIAMKHVVATHPAKTLKKKRRGKNKDKNTLLLFFDQVV